MTQCKILNVELSNLQLHKLKSAIKSGIEVTLNLSSNVVSGSTDETNFSHELLSADTQVSKTRKAFENGSSGNTKFSKMQLPKMIQSGGFLGELLVVIPYAMLHAGKDALKNV